MATINYLSKEGLQVLANTVGPASFSVNGRAINSVSANRLCDIQHIPNDWTTGIILEVRASTAASQVNLCVLSGTSTSQTPSAKVNIGSTLTGSNRNTITLLIRANNIVYVYQGNALSTATTFTWSYKTKFEFDYADNPADCTIGFMRTKTAAVSTNYMVYGFFS